ncbi:MAG: hypothetical protein ACNA8W_15860 [Bradymonadaceae bacterium]
MCVFFRVGCLVLVWIFVATGCSSDKPAATEPEAEGPEARPQLLGPCSATGECPEGLSCLCGLCTQPCDEPDEDELDACELLHENAFCAGEGSLFVDYCLEEPPAICLLRCDEDSTCKAIDSRMSCLEEQCYVTEPIPIEPPEEWDGRTLSWCDLDEDCADGLSCHCGACTIACSGYQSCASIHEGASCSSTGDRCGDGAPSAICKLSCSTSVSCEVYGDDLECVNHQCMRNIPAGMPPRVTNTSDPRFEGTRCYRAYTDDSMKEECSGNFGCSSRAVSCGSCACVRCADEYCLERVCDDGGSEECPGSPWSEDVGYDDAF